MTRCAQLITIALPLTGVAESQGPYSNPARISPSLTGAHAPQRRLVKTPAVARRLTATCPRSATSPMISIVGTGLSLPCDVEPYGPGDREFAAAQRLLCRVVGAAGKRFAQYVVVDGGLAGAPFLHAAGDLGLRVVARLKENLPELFGAAQPVDSVRGFAATASTLACIPAKTAPLHPRAALPCTKIHSSSTPTPAAKIPLLSPLFIPARTHKFRNGRLRCCLFDGKLQSP